jgi:hypothetical protein
MKGRPASARRVTLPVLSLPAIGALRAAAQEKTNVPGALAGAPPATVERITIHCAATHGIVGLTLAAG